MKIEFSTIYGVYDYACDAAGQWAQHSVKWIDNASSYLQNSPQSYLALIGANIVLFEVARSICYLVSCIFDRYENYENLSVRDQYKRSSVLGVVFLVILSGSIWGFCKTFRLPLSTMRVIVVSCLTSFVYLCVKAAR